MLEEKTVQKMEIEEDGKIRVLECTVVLDDGVEIARSVMRKRSICPGDDVESETLAVSNVAKTLHSESVITAHFDNIKSQTESVQAHAKIEANKQSALARMKAR